MGIILAVSSSWLDQQGAEGRRLLDIWDLLFISIKQEGSFSQYIQPKEVGTHMFHDLDLMLV